VSGKLTKSHRPGTFRYLTMFYQTLRFAVPNIEVQSANIAGCVESSLLKK